MGSYEKGLVNILDEVKMVEDILVGEDSEFVLKMKLFCFEVFVFDSE